VTNGRRVTGYDSGGILKVVELVDDDFTFGEQSPNLEIAW
jgi:hypothetical protein